MFQSKQLGLADRWSAVKKAYAESNKALGDIIKVTPSSKVVGDLAQFMVQNDLDAKSLVEQADSLSLPNSVVEYFQGYLGIPHYGFPEELRNKVLKGKTLESGKSMFDGRPGAEMESYDFEAAKAELKAKHPQSEITDEDVLSHAIYPAVYDEYMKFKEKYGDMRFLDTRSFVSGMEIDQEIELDIEHGKTIYVKLVAVGDVHKTDGTRDVIFELNGRQRVMKVKDDAAGVGAVERAKALDTVPGSVGAPMPGVVVEVKVVAGEQVEAGQALCVLSAMKMETVVSAPVSGRVSNISVQVGDSMKPGDLLVDIDESGEEAV